MHRSSLLWAAALFATSTSTVAQPVMPVRPVLEPVAPLTSPSIGDDAQSEWNSPGLFWSGAVLGVLGVGHLGVGGWLLQPKPCGSSPFAAYGCLAANGKRSAFGAFLTAQGSLFLATGLPLMVAGAWTVPVVDGNEEPCPKPRVSVGLGTFELTWGF